MKRMMETMDAAGDMMSTAVYSKPYTKIAIWEFKRGYGGAGRKRKPTPSNSLDLLAILDTPTSILHPPLLLKWWHKLTNERIVHKREHAFLVFKRDRREKCIVMSDYTFDFIKEKNGYYGIGYKLLILTGGPRLYIMNLNDFFRWCRPQRTFGDGTKRFIRRRKPKRIIKRRKI
jgi:hypothetical protein